MAVRLGALIFAIAANLFLVGLFFRAMTNPLDYTDFIYKTGIMIFMIEFMSLHSSGMFLGSIQESQKKGKPLMPPKMKIGLVCMYILFVGSFAAMTRQWLPAAYFVVSLASKVFYSRSIDVEERMAPVAAGIVMLLLSTFAVVFGASLIEGWFPFPAEVRAAKPAGQSGLFIDTPQTLMAWGMLYFVLITLCEIGIFRKVLKKTAGPRGAIVASNAPAAR